MKLFYLIFSLLFCSNNFYAQTVSDNRIEFAKIVQGKISYKLDTLLYKPQVSNKIFSKESNVTFDKIEICHQFTLEDIQIEYSYVILHDFDKNLKTVRFLDKIKDTYYLNNSDTFKKTYLSCVGDKSKCSPNIMITNKSQMEWICSNKVGVCSIDATECKMFKTVLID
jgi:hypothetical protein